MSDSSVRLKPEKAYSTIFDNLGLLDKGGRTTFALHPLLAGLTTRDNSLILSCDHSGILMLTSDHTLFWNIISRFFLIL